MSSVANPSAAELLNTLESWGVRNLRALAALPEVAVTERLGQAGLQWQRMARGASTRALNVVEAAAKFEEACELEYPVESLEPLSFVLNRMLEQLCARLAARALATNELRVSLGLDSVEDLESTRKRGNTEDLKSGIGNLQTKDKSARGDNHKLQITNCESARQQIFTRAVRLPVPMLDAKIFLKLLQLDLNQHPPGAPVVKIAIEAHAAEPRRAQTGLFEAGAPEPERLEVTLARIGNIIPHAPEHQGSSAPRIGVAEVLDTHRPDAFRMQRFVAGNQKSEIRNRQSAIGKSVTALRLFRPPIAAQVTVRAGKPARVESEVVTGEIAWAAGPWKASGEWWTEEPWAREEWDVCAASGCYRVYRDATGWWVEGGYD